MSSRNTRALLSVSIISSSLVLLALSGSALAVDQYDAPASYYASATSTNGATLQTQLRTIVSVMTPINYGDARYSMPTTDLDPNNASNLLTAYSRASTSNVWDSGVTWNREHVWPQSRLGASASNGTANIASDQFGLRPALSSQNSSRGNNSYGGTFGSTTLGNHGSLFYPGDVDAGDVARACFYMATRYSQLKIVNGSGVPANLEMGNLADLLVYNYADVPDTFERRRNHSVYGLPGATGVTIANVYAQKNRNPFVDHPEYVWSIYGGGNNNSQVSVAAPAADGSSTSAVDFGTVIVGAPLPSLSTNVTISKSGANPTYIDVSAAGAASSSISGRFNAFGYNAGTKSSTVGLTATTATAGHITGSVTVDNLDITSGAAGQGSADGNDVVSLAFNVLNHSNASFSSVIDADSMTVNLGSVATGQSIFSSVSLFNLVTTSADLTVGLDLDSVTGSDAAFTIGNTSFSNLLAGSSASLPVSFTAPNSNGFFSVTYTLFSSDFNLSGATNGTPLTLTLQANAIPEPGALCFLALPLVALRRRR